MQINPPFQISSRLLPALHICGAWISIEEINGYKVRYFIDLPDGTEIESDDLSCRAGITLIGAFTSLLSFIGAFAEARQYQDMTGRESENADLFPDSMAEWATQNSDEIGMISIELEESETAFFV